MKDYPAAFEIWWNENKRSESLRDGYENYKLDVACTQEGCMTFKRWALGQWQED
jgi:hypothetical protein